MNSLTFITKALDHMLYCAHMIGHEEYGKPALKSFDLYQQEILKPIEILYRYTNMIYETEKELDRFDFKFINETIFTLLESIKMEITIIDNTIYDTYEMIIDYFDRIEENAKFIRKICNFELY